MDLCDKEEKWNNMGCLKFYDLHASTKLSDVASASAKPKKKNNCRRSDWGAWCEDKIGGLFASLPFLLPQVRMKTILMIIARSIKGWSFFIPPESEDSDEVRWTSLA